VVGILEVPTTIVCSSYTPFSLQSKTRAALQMQHVMSLWQVIYCTCGWTAVVAFAIRFTITKHHLK